MSRRSALVSLPIALTLVAGCSSDPSGSSSSKEASSPTNTTSASSAFFTPQAGQKPDRLTAENGQTYIVTSKGSLVRTSEGGTVNMPSVGGMLGQGDQTIDQDYTIATARPTKDTTGMDLTIGSGSKARTVKATRGVVVDGHYYGVFVVKPSFSAEAVQKITRTTTTERTTVSR